MVQIKITMQEPHSFSDPHFEVEDFDIQSVNSDSSILKMQTVEQFFDLSREKRLEVLRRTECFAQSQN